MHRFVAAMDRALPRSLAAAKWCFRGRAFCAAAAAVSSGAQHPLPDAALLPHSVRGIISNYFDHDRPEWFVRPRGINDGSPSISMPYADDGRDDAVRDHCNGLILYERGMWCTSPPCMWVLNPATRRLAVLPPLDDNAASRYGAAGEYLAFDPSVSLHYQVFLIPEVPEPERRRRHRDGGGDGAHDDDDGSAEWPPAVHRMKVYSSRSGLWEERAFVREGGGPVGTVAEARSDSAQAFKYYGPARRYAVCWRGALYVHCRGGYVMRLSLLEDKYQIIKTPLNIVENKHTHAKHYLGRSVKGVSYIVLKRHELRVWTLHESRGQMEWVLKHHLYLGALDNQLPIIRYRNRDQIKQPWAMLYHIVDSDEYDLKVQEACEWNSDDDDILEITKGHSKLDIGDFEFLGFHPYKEVMFLHRRSFDVVACHLSSSKAQYLGNAYPHGYEWSPWASFEESFIYTPCLVDSLPKDDLSIFEPMDRE